MAMRIPLNADNISQERRSRITICHESLLERCPDYNTYDQTHLEGPCTAGPYVQKNHPRADLERLEQHLPSSEEHWLPFFHMAYRLTFCFGLAYGIGKAYLRMPKKQGVQF